MNKTDATDQAALRWARMHQTGVW